jgi:hypothetical protein
LKKIHKAINNIQDCSGWTWDNQLGANIQPDCTRAWEEFLKRVPCAKAFCNKGWIHLSKMDVLIPHVVHGTHVFSASQGTVGLGSQPLDSGPSDAPIDVPSPPSSPPFTFESQGDAPNVTPNSLSATSQPDGSTRSAATSSEEVQAFRKRKCAQTVTLNTSSSKKAKLTGPEAIQSLNQTFSKFGEDICAAISLDPLLCTPARRKEAFKRLQQESWLDISDRLLLYNHFESDSKAVDAYSALDDSLGPEFRMKWIEARLEMLKSHARTLF